jgi:hypothetical protein
MALVREFASQEAGPPGTAITATRRRTKSAASTGQWIDLIVGPSGIQSIVEVAISVFMQRLSMQGSCFVSTWCRDAD